MTHFRVGQKIVCIGKFKNNPPCYEPCIQPVKDKIYTIREIKKSKQGKVGLLLDEIVNKPTTHENGFGEQCFISTGFRPLQYISATLEIIEKFKLTEEKSDIKPQIKKEEYEKV